MSRRELRLRDQYFPGAEQLAFKTQKGGFVPLPIISRKLMRHLSPALWRTWTYLLLRAGKHGLCAPNPNEMMEELGFKSKRNLTPHLRSLEEKRLIFRNSGGGVDYYFVPDPRFCIEHLVASGQIGEEELAEINKVLADVSQDAIDPSQALSQLSNPACLTKGAQEAAVVKEKPLKETDTAYTDMLPTWVEMPLMPSSRPAVMDAPREAMPKGVAGWKPAATASKDMGSTVSQAPDQFLEVPSWVTDPLKATDRKQVEAVTAKPPVGMEQTTLETDTEREFYQRWCTHEADHRTDHKKREWVKLVKTMMERRGLTLAHLVYALDNGLIDKESRVELHPQFAGGLDGLMSLATSFPSVEFPQCLVCSDLRLDGNGSTCGHCPPKIEEEEVLSGPFYNCELFDANKPPRGALPNTSA